MRHQLWTGLLLCGLAFNTFPTTVPSFLPSALPVFASFVRYVCFCPPQKNRSPAPTESCLVSHATSEACLWCEGSTGHQREQSSWSGQREGEPPQKERELEELWRAGGRGSDVVLCVYNLLCVLAIQG